MTKLISTNPAKSYEVIGEVDVSSENEVAAKVNRAQSAKKTWKQIGLKGRVEILRKVYDKISGNTEQLALIITKETGKLLASSKSDIESGLEFLSWYLENAEKYLTPEIIFEDNKTRLTVYREPYGVVAAIVPWNFPFSNVIWGIGQHHVAGNVVVLKHSEYCPLFSKKLDELVTSCGLPQGVFTTVYGDGTVGECLVKQNIDFISFTGSTKTGKYLYQVAAEKMINLSLELGGSAPGIIFDDANLEKVIPDAIYNNRFGNSGQMCDALKRLIVHQSRFDEVVEKLKGHLETKKVGDPENLITDLGPLAAKRQLDLLISQVQDAVDKGATIIKTSPLDPGLKGAYFAPILMINVKPDMRIWKEEVFGPVLPIVSFTEEAQAIQMANDTSYGLGAYIFTEDKERAKKVSLEIDSGMIGINNVNYVQPCSPFGGFKQSGIGREHGKYGFEHVTQAKVVGCEK